MEGRASGMHEDEEFLEQQRANTREKRRPTRHGLPALLDDPNINTVSLRRTLRRTCSCEVAGGWVMKNG